MEDNHVILVVVHVIRLHVRRRTRILHILSVHVSHKLKANIRMTSCAFFPQANLQNYHCKSIFADIRTARIFTERIPMNNSHEKHEPIELTMPASDLLDQIFDINGIC
ncbi:hypothetical protein [Bifidobacterium cuniculi]|uniref:hypothetical protein n=1 Tax=Bifidobacterium cuniculi TaxID=1688 RepID=UPI0013631EC5|nr:hypothetical protein [Bifidobacterium cuniculi]